MIWFRLALAAAVLGSPALRAAEVPGASTVKAIGIRSGEHGEAARARITERLRELPGITRVAFVQEPFTRTVGRMAANGRSPEGTQRSSILLRTSPEVFAFHDLQLVEGRVLTAADRGATPLVAVVSQSLATFIAGEDSALGKQIFLGHGLIHDIVGVVAEPDDAPRVYLPLDPEADRKEILVLMEVVPSAKDTIARSPQLVCDVGSDWECDTPYFAWGRRPQGVTGSPIYHSAPAGKPVTGP